MEIVTTTTADGDEQTKHTAVRLAPFNPTCSHAQEVALNFLSLSETDVLFDLGCGDGRLLMAAAQRTPGLRCIGIEIDPVYVNRAVDALSTAPTDVASRIDIREGNVLNMIGAPEKTSDSDDGQRNLSFTADATAVFVYLLPTGLKMIQPHLESIAQQRRSEGRQFRVVSYMFRVPDWGEPNKVDRTTKGDCPVYLYDLSVSNTKQS